MDQENNLKNEKNEDFDVFVLENVFSRIEHILNVFNENKFNNTGKALMFFIIKMHYIKSSIMRCREVNDFYSSYADVFSADCLFSINNTGNLSVYIFFEPDSSGDRRISGLFARYTYAVALHLARYDYGRSFAHQRCVLFQTHGASICRCNMRMLVVC